MGRTHAQAFGIKTEPLPEPHEPEYMTEVVTVEGVKVVKHWMSFDSRYGPESEAQIEWWTKMGYNTDGWKVGKPLPRKQTAPPDPRLRELAAAA